VSGDVLTVFIAALLTARARRSVRLVAPRADVPDSERL
jgi:hypothetical protein